VVEEGNDCVNLQASLFSGLLDMRLFFLSASLFFRIRGHRFYARAIKYSPAQACRSSFFFSISAAFPPPPSPNRKVPSSPLTPLRSVPPFRESRSSRERCRLGGSCLGSSPVVSPTPFLETESPFFLQPPLKERRILLPSSSVAQELGRWKSRLGSRLSAKWILPPSSQRL